MKRLFTTSLVLSLLCTGSVALALEPDTAANHPPTPKGESSMQDLTNIRMDSHPRSTRLRSDREQYKFQYVDTIYNMRGKDYSKQFLIRTNFSKLNLTGANFSNAVLAAAKFRKADLTRANLVGADLLGADLYKANLTGADLRGADIRSTNHKGAAFREAKYDEHTFFPQKFIPEAHGMVYVPVDSPYPTEHFRK